MDATAGFEKLRALHDGRFSFLGAALRRFGLATHGQDLMEYALMGGFVGTTAAATLPNVAHSLSLIFSKVTDVLTTFSTLN